MQQQRRCAVEVQRLTNGRSSLFYSILVISTSTTATHAPPVSGDAYAPAATTTVSRSGGLWCEFRGVLRVGQQLADAMISRAVLMRVSVWVEAEGVGEQEVESEAFWATVG